MQTQKNNPGFSIILAIGLTLLLSFTGLYLVEYMIPFSRQVSGIEHASKAFYKSYAALEESIFYTYSGSNTQRGYEPDRNLLDTSLFVDTSYRVVSSGSIIPLAGKGSSDFDENWNRISQNQLVSLLVGDNRLDNNNLSIRFRVPDFDGNGSPDSLSSSSELILWQINSQNDSLSAEILWGVPYNRANFFNNNGLSRGVRLNNSLEYFSNFYTTQCGSGQECVLRFSVVNPLISQDGGQLAYLEYRIDTNGDAIPFQESYISASGISYGFRKDLEIALPHDTTSSAFDFTVLQ